MRYRKVSVEEAEAIYKLTGELPKINTESPTNAIDALRADDGVELGSMNAFWAQHMARGGLPWNSEGSKATGRTFYVGYEP